MPRATSCGTLIASRTGQLLLCHVTGTDHWDIPKGMQDPGETTLEAAMRELSEETGLCFDPLLFVDLGPTDATRISICTR
jgi:putative (di)nucleoside polyphosphate hydrolase